MARPNRRNTQKVASAPVSEPVEQEQPTIQAIELQDSMQLLSALVTATQQNNFIYTQHHENAALVDAGFAEVNPDESARDENGARPTRATNEGINYIMSQNENHAQEHEPVQEQEQAQEHDQSAPVAESTVSGTTAPASVARAAGSKFVIRDDIPLPTTKRATRGELYPFEQLNVGQSFFVPVNPETGAPKSLSSTVAGARRRSADANGNPTRDYTYASGEEDGMRGWRVWRTR